MIIILNILIDNYFPLLVMLNICNIAKKTLLNKNVYSISLGGSKRKPTPNDLDKYDVVVIGGNLGSMLSNHLDAVLGEKAKIYANYDQNYIEFTQQRNLYEAGRYIYCYV